jgi:hypothetical protein
MIHLTAAANAVGTGQSFLIAASTSNSVTVYDNGTQLQSLAATGDSVVIRPAETIASIFGAMVSGSSTVQLKSSTTALTADLVYIWNGASFKAYFFYTNNYWVDAGSFADSDNVPIYPDEAILVGRISTNTLPSTYAMTIGTVPTNTQTAIVNAPGFSYVSNPLPTAVTLSQFGFTSNPTWQTGTTANGADLVYIFQNNSWNAYFYYTNNYWVNAGTFANSNSVSIPAGSGVLVLRRATVSSPNNYIATPLTYSLN